MRAKLIGGETLFLGSPHPIWPICLPLLLGLFAGAGIATNVQSFPFLWLATALVLSAVLGLALRARSSPRRITLFLCLAMLSLGLWRGLESRQIPLPFHELPGSKLFQLRLDGDPQPGRFYWRAEAQLIAVWQNEQQQNSHQRVYLEFKQDDSLAPHLKAGDLLWLRGIYPKDPRAQNPHAFDVTRWNAIHGYAGTIRAYRAPKLVYGHESPAWRPDFSVLRGWMLSNLRLSGLSDDAFALVAAMTLGEKSAMNPELKDEFRSAGLAHILVLSGLHAGFIFLILSLACIFIPAYPRFAYFLRELLPIAGLWVFVAICGFGLSLVRAAIMISFVALGDLREIEFRPLEMLLMAASVLLFAQPLALWDVGFQLSFSALWGIFSFAWPISRRFRTKNAVLTYAKGILSASLAAQLGTLPLLLYHFGKLPLLSLLGNLFGIPLTAAIVPLGLLLSLLPGASWLSLAVGYIEGLFATALIWLTSLVQVIPALQLSGMRIGLGVCFLLLASSLLMGLALRSHLPQLWRGGLVLLILAVGIASYQSLMRRCASEYRLLYGGKRPMVLYRRGPTIYYLMDSTRSNWRSLQDYASDIPGHELVPWPMEEGQPVHFAPKAASLD